MATVFDTAWAGSESSYAEANACLARMEADIRAGVSYPGKDDEDEDELPYNLSIQGNVGVITTKGPLMNIDSPYARYYGITTYADIRRAFIAAAEHQDVQAIAHVIGSGGGAVAGLDDTSQLIMSIDQGLKPVFTYTGDTMASAALWLGVSSREVHAARMSAIGSVGIIATFVEQSKAMKDAGLGVTVLRAGKYKALMHPFEPHTDAGVRQAMDQLQASYDVFIGHVAARRKVTVEKADETMGQGRMFFGQQAVQVGLVDSITSYDRFIGSVSAMISPERRVTPLSNGKDMRALTDANIAALAAGAPPASVLAGAAQPGQAGPAPKDLASADAGSAQEGGPAPAQAGAEGAATPPAATGSASEQQTAAGAEADSGQAAVVEFLRKELRETQAALADSGMQLKQLQAQVSAMSTTHESLAAIATQSLSSMRVALGGRAVQGKLSVEQLLAEHAEATTEFKAAFRAGGVAAVSQPDSPGSAQAPISSFAASRRAATNFNFK